MNNFIFKLMNNSKKYIDEYNNKIIYINNYIKIINSLNNTNINLIKKKDITLLLLNPYNNDILIHIKNMDKLYYSIIHLNITINDLITLLEVINNEKILLKRNITQKPIIMPTSISKPTQKPIIMPTSISKPTQEPEPKQKSEPIPIQKQEQISRPISIPIEKIVNPNQYNPYYDEYFEYYDDYYYGLNDEDEDNIDLEYNYKNYFKIINKIKFTNFDINRLDSLKNRFLSNGIIYNYESNLEIENILYKKCINIFINILLYNKKINKDDDNLLITEFIKYINLIFKLNINQVIIIKYIYLLIIFNHDFDFILNNIKNINKYLYKNPYNIIN